MKKEILFDQDALNRLKAGVDKLANVVKSTLGPGGSNVILGRDNHSAAITKDGVSVAREIFLEDPIEDIGAQIVKEVASRTAQYAGDGTTTATVLAQAIFAAGLKHLAAGANGISLKRGIDHATKIIVERLRQMSTPITEKEDLLKVAVISANGDKEIGNIVAEAMARIGKDGVVAVQTSPSMKTAIKFVEGMQIERGWLSPHFVTMRETMEYNVEDPVILIYDGVISSMREQLMNILTRYKTELPGNPLVLIADDVIGDALATLSMNVYKGALPNFCAIQAPGFGDMRKEFMSDIAAVTGATVVSKDTGLTLDNAPMSVFGKCERARIGQLKTTLVGGKGGLPWQRRIRQLQELIEGADNENTRTNLKDRLAIIQNGVAVIYVGGASEIEIQEKKDRIDDAIQATRAALSEGIVMGGGVAYVHATAEKMEGTLQDDEAIGARIVWEAVKSPIKTIAENVGENGDVVLNEVVDYCSMGAKIGYNAKTRTYENLMDTGIIDPTKVARLALENAASVAGLLLTSKSIVSHKP